MARDSCCYYSCSDVEKFYHIVKPILLQVQRFKNFCIHVSMTVSNVLRLSIIGSIHVEKSENSCHIVRQLHFFAFWGRIGPEINFLSCIGASNTPLRIKRYTAIVRFPLIVD